MLHPRRRYAVSQDIVCMENVRRYYGDKPDLVAKYEEIAASGKCPFCAPNIENPLVSETARWMIVENQFPYKNAKNHLLLIPRRHLVRLSHVAVEEWADFAVAIRKAHLATRCYDGFGLALRVGEVGGVTLHHLHWHLIVPEIGEKGTAIPVNFGIG